jgi:DNA processing protein
MTTAADLAWLAESPQHHIIHYDDAMYPALLREIPRPPRVLYAIGNIDLLHTPQLAIVGSRKPTATGRDTAKQFSYHLAKAGFTITSGLALGIDGASHEGALAAAGNTIAVLGCGLQQIYPPNHKALAQRIKETGLLISEFAPDMPPLAANFPQRNRIISGLSLATLVVEAAVQSGSLITARFACEQGREVFAIPGSIHNPQARGCHALIKQGAKLVETVDDIVEELPALLQYSLQLSIPTASPPLAVSQVIDNKQHELPELGVENACHFMLKYVGYEPTTFDTIINRSSLPAEQVSAILVQLELDGLIESLTHGYIRTQRPTL